MPLLALETDTLVLVPRGLAVSMSRWLPLKIFDLPGRPMKLELHLVWGPVLDTDPAHRWFRDRLIELMAKAA